MIVGRACYGLSMSRSFSARVHNGVIVADEVALVEGETVTVVLNGVADADDGELTDEELDAVERGRAELARGEGVSIDELRAMLRRDREQRDREHAAVPASSGSRTAR